MFIQTWRNRWLRKTHATRTAIKLTILAETMMLFFLAWGFIPYWRELVKIETPVYAQITESIKIEPMPSAVLDTINYYAKLFGVSPELAIKITTCESKNNPYVIGNEKVALNSYGLWQWQPQSFYQYAAKYKIKNANLYDYRDQTIIAMMVLRDGGGSIWTCNK